MTSFNSETYSLSTSRTEVSQFLAEPSNLYEILPQDRIENWNVNGDQCSFKIKGLADIALKLESATNTEVIYASTSEKPFSFKLIVMLDEATSGSSISAKFDADVNSFMGMMLKTPLTNFLNSLGKALNQKYS
mgnify:CR=1 FL=1|jgi:hypothetical protein